MATYEIENHDALADEAVHQQSRKRGATGHCTVFPVLHLEELYKRWSADTEAEEPVELPRLGRELRHLVMVQFRGRRLPEREQRLGSGC